jgi:DNA polymerase-3 subunit delta'
VVPQGLSISVSEMRAVVAEAARLPVVGSWQVMIIEDADRLTEAASNALLKVVEEPPRRTVFLLCAPSTHPDDVAMTIRSRCRHLALRTPPADAIAAVLTGEGAAPGMAAWAAQASQGHVGRARRLVRDSDARARRAAVLAVPERVRSLRDCQEVADALITAAESEAQAATDGVDEAEARIRTVPTPTDCRAPPASRVAWPARCVSCSSGNARGPPARNATRSTAR